MVEYFVSLTGNDFYNGLSIEQAWRTIQKAANSVSAGDTVHVQSGTYNEAITISKSGTADQRIIFVGENYPTVVTTGTGFKINGNYVTVTGFTIKNANYGIWGYGNGNGVNYLNITYNIMDDFSVNVGILIWTGSNYTTIEHNTINSINSAVELDGTLWYGSVSYNSLNTSFYDIETLFMWGGGDGKNYMNFVGNTIRGGRNGFGGGPRSYGYIANNNISGYFHNGLNFHSMTYSIVENNWIGDSKGGDTQHAIYIDGSTKTWHDNVFRNNYVEAASHGTCFNVNNAENAIVENLTAKYCSAEGILIISDDTYGTATPSGNFTFRNVSFFTNTYTGVRFDAVGNTVLSNNYYFTDINISGPNLLSGWTYDDPGTRPTSYIINTNLPTTRWVSGATGGEFRFYYPLDIKVVDTNGNPIYGATGTITNDVDSNYPSINYNFENKTTFTTGADGHTSLPSDKENSIAIMDFRRTSSTTNYMTYTITVEKDGKTNSTTINPDRSWYRLNPNTYQNTVIIVLPIVADITPPIITDISSSNATSSGATITWTTNEPATSQVEYGLTDGYGSNTSLDSNLVTNHSMTLTGLNPSTLYHFRIYSRDASGNLATSNDYNFTTNADSIVSNIRIWDTGRIETGNVHYMSAWNTRSSWTEILKGTTGTINNDLVLEGKNFWFNIHGSAWNANFGFLKGGYIPGDWSGGAATPDAPSRKNEMYRSFDTPGGYRAYGEGSDTHTVLVNNASEIVIRSTSFPTSKPDGSWAVTTDYRILNNKSWMEIKPVNQATEQGFHGETRILVFPDANGNGNDYLADSNDYASGSNNGWLQLPNGKMMLNFFMEGDGIWLMTWPTPANARPYVEWYFGGWPGGWDYVDGTTLTNGNIFSSPFAKFGNGTESIYVGFLNGQWNHSYWLFRSINQNLNAGTVYSNWRVDFQRSPKYGQTWTPQYPGIYRLIGKVNGNYYTQEVNLTSTTIPLQFTMPVNGNLEYVLIYLYDRNTNTPLDISTVMDIYRDATSSCPTPICIINISII